MSSSRTVPAPNDRAFAQFVGAIHQSLDVGRVGSDYMATIRSLVQANAYGFYLFSRDDGRPLRVAVSGGVDRFIARYEEEVYAHDPLLRHVARTKEPVHDGLLFSECEWQRSPLRMALTVQYKAPRILEAPLFIDGRLQGILYFTRRPDSSPPFGIAELRTLKLVAQEVCSAMDHALRFAALKERCAYSEGTLQMLDVPLILSDEQGHIKFTNRAAELTLSAADETVRSGRFHETLHENLGLLVLGSQDTTAGSVGLNETEGKSRSLLLRSTRVPSMEHIVATFLSRTEARVAASFDHMRPLLSERELDVLALLAQGMQNKEVAQRLFVSTNTVKYHVKRMYRALRVTSRAELLSRAYADSQAGFSRR